MELSTEPFHQAKQQWNLEKLYQDLAEAKQCYCGKLKKLTPVEIACLRGLLCGFSPPEIAVELKREPRGLRVDLSRGLYRYVEVLAQRQLNELKDWRDVASWLSYYQIHSAISNDSDIKIVDISLSGTRQIPVLDIKVRNVGQKVAFLKKAKFKFYKTWVLASWIPTLKAEEYAVKFERELSPIPMAQSRAVEPSFDYEVKFPNVEGNRIELEQASFSLLTKEFRISQCVGCNDVDRFTLSLSFPQETAKTSVFGYQTRIYHLRLEIIYDEDDKIVESEDLVLGVEPESFPPLSDRCFFYTSNQEDTNNLKLYSAQNRAILEEISKIEGLQSEILRQLY